MEVQIRWMVSWTRISPELAPTVKETELELLGNMDAAFVWQRKGEVLLYPTVKHGGVNIMLQGCFAASGTGNLVRVHRIMNTGD